jgi:type IV secretory pathway protease TraF
VSRRTGPWTHQENHLLKAVVAQGVSIARASVAFKRTISAVRNQARKLGAPFPTMQEVRKKLAEVSLGNLRQR